MTRHTPIQSIIDTNVIVRFLIGDNASQQAKAKKWFEEAEAGKRDILVPALVVAETCFVLESFYKISRKDIVDSMTVFVSQKWLQIPERNVLLSLWARYLAGFHFVDSYLIALSSQGENEELRCEILSLDKKLIREK